MSKQTNFLLITLSLTALYFFKTIELEEFSGTGAEGEISLSAEDGAEVADNWSEGLIPRLMQMERGVNPHNYDDSTLAVANRLGADTVEIRRLPLIQTLSDEISLDLGSGVAELKRRSYRSENFQVVVQGDDGSVTVADPGEVRTYIGRLSSQQDATVTAYLGEHGIIGRISDPIEGNISIDPLTQEEAQALEHTIPGIGALHAFHVPLKTRQVNIGSFPDYYNEEGVLVSALGEDGVVGTAPGGGAAPRVVDNVCVKEAEIGMDVTFRFFNERGGANVNTTKGLMEAWLMNEIGVFERDCLVRHVLGTLVIRTSSANDPYRSLDNNPNDDSGGLLNLTRSIWNASGFPLNLNNVTIFQDGTNVTTGGASASQHDLAITVLNRVTGVTGLANVGQVGTSSGYGHVTANSGLGFWRNGGQHEIGHIWSLLHGDGCNQEPTVNGNTNTGIICGGEQGRANSIEVAKVIAHRDSRAPGVLPETTPSGPLAPNTLVDRLDVIIGEVSMLDVLANDFDANNDNFFIAELMTGNQPFPAVPRQIRQDQTIPTAISTALGGSVIRSIGTGPNGRDQVQYTAPAGLSPGTNDSFFYLAEDLTGQRNWGYVEITLTGELLFVESFIYPAGEITGKSLDGNTWVDAVAGDKAIVTPSSSLLAGPEDFLTGGGVLTQTGSDRISLALPGDASGGEDGTVRYISFVQKLSFGESNRSQLVEFWNGNPGSVTAMSFGTDSNMIAPSYGLLLNKGSQNVSLGVGGPDTNAHLIVLKIEYGANDVDTVSVYVDPDATEPAMANASNSATGLDFNRIGFAAFQGGGQQVDELRIGSTFESVVPLEMPQLFFEENFAHSGGSLIGKGIGGETWQDESTAAGGSTTVESGGSLFVNDPSNFLNVGGRVIQTGNDRVSLALNESASGGSDNTVRYISFVQKLGTADGAKTRIVEFWKGNASTNSIFSFGTDTGNAALNYGLLIAKGTGNIALNVGPPSADERLVVLKVEYGSADADSISVYVDPGADEPATPSHQSFFTDLSFDRIGLGAFQGGIQEVDEIRIGATFSDVVPLAGPALLFEESFSYPAGDLVGNTNDNEDWEDVSAGGTTSVLDTESLTPPDFLGFNTSGGRVMQIGGDRYTLPLPVGAIGGSDGTVRYISFIQKLAFADAERSQVVEFWNGAATTNNTSFSFGTDTWPGSPDYGLFIDKNGANIPLSLGNPDTQAHLIVLKVEYGANDADSISVFVDPGETEPAIPDASSNAINLAFNRIGFGAFQSGSQEVDEIRIGRTYEDVVAFTDLDVDDDGLPDSFEEENYGGSITTTDGTDDLDGDGQNDRAEFIAGTDPTDGNSVFSVRPGGVEAVSTTEIRLSWNSVMGKDYSVWATSTLIAEDWTRIIDSEVATGPITTVNVPRSGVQRFYQIRVNE